MSNTITQACAACKYQRRKCSPDCPLAPFFPASHTRQFLNVHRLFGVSNVLRILRQVEPFMQADTVKSIVYEADAWDRDPVYGCWGLISLLQNHVHSLQAALAHARSRIFLLEQRPNQLNNFHNINSQAINTSFPNDHHHNLLIGDQDHHNGSANAATSLSDFTALGAVKFTALGAGIPEGGSAVLDVNVGSYDKLELCSAHGITREQS